jgi:hypothetical protein
MMTERAAKEALTAIVVIVIIIVFGGIAIALLQNGGL